MQTSRTLIVAGSETTATALSGATFLLCTNPQVLSKLADEVRSSFTTEAEITLLSVQKLQYMLAVLDESIRTYPPVLGSVPREVRQGGDVICGHYLPAGVSTPMRCDQLSLIVEADAHVDCREHLAMADVPQP